MAEHPLWERIGRGFVHHYYQQFDVDRTQLGTLYEESGCPSFSDRLPKGVRTFLLSPPGLSRCFSDCSCLTWEGQPFQGKAAIMEKIASLPFQKIQHSITAEDHQPAPDSCVLSMVVGQLKVDDDPVMGFHQLFLLKNDNDKWICTNDMFRLALHNFC